MFVPPGNKNNMKKETVGNAKDIGKDLSKVMKDWYADISKKTKTHFKNLKKELNSMMKDVGKNLKKNIGAGLKGVGENIKGVFGTAFKWITRGFIATIGFILGMSVKMFSDFSGYIETAIKSFGAISSITAETIIGTNKELRYIGKSFDDITGAMDEFQSSMGLSEQAALSLAKQMAYISRDTGISEGEAAKLTVSFTKILGTSKETAINLIKGFGSLVKGNHKAILKDMANSQELIAKYGKGMGFNIMNAANFARKFGNELSTIEKTMSSLLDFESSIEKQMEASMLIGRQINYQDAARFALQGDMVQAMKIVLAQVGGQAEWDKLNVLQRQALADSIGQSVADMSKFVKASGAANDITAATADSLADAANNTDKMKHSAWVQLYSVLTDLYDTIMLQLAPAFNFITDRVTVWVKFLKKGLKEGEGSITSLSKWVIESWMKVEIWMWDKIIGPKGIFGKMSAEGSIWKKVKQGFMNVLSFIGGVFVTGIDKAFGLMFSKTGAKVLAMVGTLMLLSWAFTKIGTKGVYHMLGIAGAIYVMSLAVEKMSEAIEGNEKNLIGMIIGIGALALITKLMGDAAVPMAKGLAIMVGLAAALYLIGLAISETMPAWEWLGDQITKYIGYMKHLITEIKELLIPVVKTLGDMFKVLGDVVVGVVDSISQAIVGLADIMSDFVIGSLNAINDILTTIGDTIKTVVTAITTGIVEIATIISNTILGIMDRIENIINAVSSGIVNVIKEIRAYQDVDPAAILKVAGAYSSLAVAIGGLAASTAAHGAAGLFKSLTGFLSRGVDAVADFFFGKEDTGQMVTNVNQTVRMSSNDINRIGQATADAVLAGTMKVTVENQPTVNMVKFG